MIHTTCTCRPRRSASLVIRVAVVAAWQVTVAAAAAAASWSPAARRRAAAGRPGRRLWVLLHCKPREASGAASLLVNLDGAMRPVHYEAILTSIDAPRRSQRFAISQQGRPAQALAFPSPARTPAWRAVDWSRGLAEPSQREKQRQRGHNAGAQQSPHMSTGSAAPRPVGRLSHRPGRRFTCSFLSGVASRTMTKFVRALAVPKECCSAAGQPQTAPWTRLRRGAPPRHPRGCRRGMRCHPVRPL